LSVTAVADAPVIHAQTTIVSLEAGATSASGSAAVTQTNLETAVGLTAGKLDTFDPPAGALSDPGTIDVFNGGVSNSTYRLSTGTAVSFSWNFTNGETVASEIQGGYNDMLILVVTDPNGGQTFNQITSSEQLGASTNGAGTFSFTPTIAGTHSFSWLVTNGNDALKNSTAAISDATFTMGGNSYGVPIEFPINAGLADTDGSESLSVTVSGVPANAAFSAGTNLGGGSWGFTTAQMVGLTLLPAHGYTGTLDLTVNATATEASNGSTATSSQIIHVTVDHTTSNLIGAQGNDALTGTAGNDHMQGLVGADTLNGGTGNDLIYGGAGNDTINGGDGSNMLYGGAGNDIITGGVNNDYISGDAGSDSLTGGAGADVFAWHLADKGVAGTPAVDTITDFNVATPASGGDLLEIRDLLTGENSGNLERFLDFDTTSTPGSTIIHVSTAGAFPTGSAWTAGQAASEDQRIVLQGVDLRSAFGLGAAASDNQVIQELLQRGKLVTDGP
jgi:Ca2+-binding RTX toxin-like protein